MCGSQPTASWPIPAWFRWNSAPALNKVTKDHILEKARSFVNPPYGQPHGIEAFQILVVEPSYEHYPKEGLIFRKNPEEIRKEREDRMRKEEKKPEALALLESACTKPPEREVGKVGQPNTTQGDTSDDDSDDDLEIVETVVEPPTKVMKLH